VYINHIFVSLIHLTFAKSYNELNRINIFKFIHVFNIKFLNIQYILTKAKLDLFFIFDIIYSENITFTMRPFSLLHAYYIFLLPYI